MTEVPGSGPLDSKVWCIGEAPGQQEEHDGKPFVGASGLFLREKLMYVGIHPDSVRYENLINFRPPKNDFEYFESDPKRKAELLASVAALKKRIADCKPSLVILLGAKPTKYLCGGKNIGDWRGHIFTIEGTNTKAICTYHPSACIRQRFVPKDQKPGQYETLFIIDLKRAQKEHSFPEIKTPKYKLIINPTLTDVESFYSEAMTHGQFLSYDIETLGRSFVDCIGFATTREFAICIPLYHPNPTGVVPYWKKEEAPQVFQIIRLLLESMIPKVAQNSQFDTLILKEYYGITVRNLFWDTLVSAHDIYCDLPKSLGDLMALYTDLPYHKFMIKEGSNQSRWTYNALDALANIHIMHGEIAEAKELGVFVHYCTIPNPAITICTEMEQEGTLVDIKYRDMEITRQTQIQETLSWIINQVFPRKFGSNKKDPLFFNPNSWQQRQVLFYDLLHCAKSYNKGTLTTDVDAMQKFADKTEKEYVKQLVNLCTSFKSASYMQSKLEVPLRNGRMHSKFSVTGTDTGRLNSSESIFGTGTNLQNLEKGPQRRMLIPDPGCEFFIPDLWAAEAYLTALEAGETKYLELLGKGIKIHKWLLGKVTERWEAEVKRTGFDYDMAKTCIHGMNYGAEPGKLYTTTHLSMEVCSWMYSFYHSEFPRIKERQRRLKDQLYTDRTLTSLLGRKRVFIAPMGGELLNIAYAWPTQSAIGELALLAMTKLAWRAKAGTIPYFHPRINTHDGFVAEILLGTRDAIKAAAIDAFNIPFTVGDKTVTVPVEIAWGSSFQDRGEEEIVLR